MDRDRSDRNPRHDHPFTPTAFLALITGMLLAQFFSVFLFS